MSGDELIDVRLPTRIAEAMHHAHTQSVMCTAFMATEWARHLVEANPDLRPLTRGDFAERASDVYVIVGEYIGTESLKHILVGVRANGYDAAPIDSWRRCDPPSDPAVKAALLKAAFIEDEGEQ